MRYGCLLSAGSWYLYLIDLKKENTLILFDQVPPLPSPRVCNILGTLAAPVLPQTGTKVLIRFRYWWQLAPTITSIYTSTRRCLFPCFDWWSVTSIPSSRLFTTLKSLGAPSTGIDAVTNTYTTNQRIHSIHVDVVNHYWNPSIISLPANAPAEYVLVARVLTNGLYQQSIICSANWTDIHQALRCITEPRVLDIPSTSARLCGQANSSASKVLANIPGLHDGRVMWTERGEVLMIGGSQEVIDKWFTSKTDYNWRLR